MKGERFVYFMVCLVLCLGFMLFGFGKEGVTGIGESSKERREGERGNIEIIRKVKEDVKGSEDKASIRGSVVNGGERYSVVFKQAPLIEILTYFGSRLGVSYVFEYPSLGVRDTEVIKEVRGGSGNMTMPGFSGGGMMPGGMIPGGMMPGGGMSSFQVRGQGDTSVVDIEKRVISFSMHNATVEEIIKSFCESADVKCEYDKKKQKLTIKPYDLYLADISLFFDYDVSYDLGLQGRGGTGGGSGSGGTGSGGGSSGGGFASGGSNSYKFSEKLEDLLDKVKIFLSNEGKAVLSKRGYLVVLDRPSRVKKIKEILDKEIGKQEPVFLNVKVIRIDKTKAYESGINWDVVATNLFSDISSLRVTTDFVSSVGKTASGGGPLTISFGRDGLNVLLRYLENYGDIRIVHDWSVKARGSIPLVFSDIESVPYVTETTTVSEGTTTQSRTPNFVDVGIKIGIDGTIEGENYKGQVFINISQLIELRNLGSSDSPLYVPFVKSSVVTVPLTLKLGEAMLVSGFKINKTGISQSGIPYLSKIPILGRLFGYYGKEDADSELIVIIIPDKMK